ncbi:hypothetical protein Syun_018510 [Stephania yunnanensis]|uniref:Uncharacterized protein n=1 Tax=Stephania yunnanensis TaxID=152371 RepID=A0AAP0NVW7_9MAGN
MHFSPKFNFTIRHCSHYSSLRKLPKLRMQNPQLSQTPSDPPSPTSPNRVPLLRQIPHLHPCREHQKQLTLLALRTHLQSRILATELLQKLPQVPQNKLKNLPYLLRAIDLHEWFFEKIMNGDHHLLAGVNNGSLDDAVENEFKKGLE